MSSELSWVVPIKITRVVIWIVTRHRVSSLRCEPLRRSATRADVLPAKHWPSGTCSARLFEVLLHPADTREEISQESWRGNSVIWTRTIVDRFIVFWLFLEIVKIDDFWYFLAPSRKRSKTAFFWPLQFYWIYCYWAHLWCCWQHLEGHFFTKNSLFEVL